MKKRTQGESGRVSSILARTLTSDGKPMSAAVARWFLKWGFSRADQDRMADLAERNQEGVLSPSEKAELMEYVDVGHLVAQLHAIAHMALGRSRAGKV